MLKLKFFHKLATLLTCCSMMLIVSACSSFPVAPPVEIHCKLPTVPVRGHAQAFVGDAPIKFADITWIEKNKHFKTNQHGLFAFCAQPGQRITLMLHRKSKSSWHNYYPTQTSTVWVSKHGLQDKYHEITFQVPRNITFENLRKLLQYERDISMDNTQCHVATTITAQGKTLEDDIQGEDGAKLILYKNGKRVFPANKPFYFGIIFGKTNPFTSKRDRLSADGGLLIYNLPASKQIYTMTASKPGTKFSKAYFWCRKGIFINVSPPHAPGVIAKLKPKPRAHQHG